MHGLFRVRDQAGILKLSSMDTPSIVTTPAFRSALQEGMEGQAYSWSESFLTQVLSLPPPQQVFDVTITSIKKISQTVFSSALYATQL